MTDRKPGPGDEWIDGFDWKGDGSQTVQCLDCRRAVSFPFGQQQHGTHRIVVPEPVVEETPVTDDASPERQNAEVALPVAVCSTCGATYDEAVPFCSRCGTETEPPDAPAIMEALRREIVTLRGEVAASHEEYVALKSESHQAISSLKARLDRRSDAITWRAILPQEKWTMAWGVWWRTLVAGLAVYVLLIFLVLAVAGGDS
jgi:hypothetical protein